MTEWSVIGPMLEELIRQCPLSGIEILPPWGEDEIWKAKTPFRDWISGASLPEVILAAHAEVFGPLRQVDPRHVDPHETQDVDDHRQDDQHLDEELDGGVHGRRRCDD